MAELKKGIPITGAARSKLGAGLARKYQKGASIRSLAQETGRSYGFVHSLLEETGVAMRGRGGSHRPPRT